MAKTDLENTFVILTDDKNFMQALSYFISNHCEKNNVNVACYNLNKNGAKKVMDIVFEQ